MFQIVGVPPMNRLFILIIFTLVFVNACGWGAIGRNSIYTCSTDRDCDWVDSSCCHTQFTCANVQRSKIDCPAQIVCPMIAVRPPSQDSCLCADNKCQEIHASIPTIKEVITLSRDTILTKHEFLITGSREFNQRIEIGVFNPTKGPVEMIPELDCDDSGIGISAGFILPPSIEPNSYHLFSSSISFRKDPPITSGIKRCRILAKMDGVAYEKNLTIIIESYPKNKIGEYILSKCEMQLGPEHIWDTRYLNCYSSLGARWNYAEICRKVNSTFDRLQCYRHIAHNNPSACESIDNEEIKRECHDSLNSVPQLTQY